MVLYCYSVSICCRLVILFHKWSTGVCITGWSGRLTLPQLTDLMMSSGWMSTYSADCLTSRLCDSVYSQFSHRLGFSLITMYAAWNDDFNEPFERRVEWNKYPMIIVSQVNLDATHSAPQWTAVSKLLSNSICVNKYLQLFPPAVCKYTHSQQRYKPNMTTCTFVWFIDSCVFCFFFWTGINTVTYTVNVLCSARLVVCRSQPRHLCVE